MHTYSLNEICVACWREIIFLQFQVSARVNSELTKRAEQFGLILDDISITHLTFGREFTAAVELKQVQSVTDLD